MTTREIADEIGDMVAHFGHVSTPADGSSSTLSPSDVTVRCGSLLAALGYLRGRVAAQADAEEEAAGVKSAGPSPPEAAA
jgi:hypothetical protein